MKLKNIKNYLNEKSQTVGIKTQRSTMVSPVNFWTAKQWKTIC